MTIIKKILTVFCLFLLLFLPSVSHASFIATNSPEVQAFINKMVIRYHFDREKLQILFSHVVLNEEVIARVSKPAEAKPWYIYRELFLTPARINKGTAYWKEHEKTLALAEERYGVPASIIVSIIGVETQYGENKGTFPIFNTLTTLAFNHGRRAEFFRSELAEYLLLSREQNYKPLLLKGSYAGAMGLPQFMPSSYRLYAVDFYHKGQCDLINNHADAIGSVGNYLKAHGWKKGETVAVPARALGTQYVHLHRKSLQPHFSSHTLAKYGIYPMSHLSANQKTTYIRLQGKNGDEHWLGLKNFYVISTYNKSELYVMAVNELAQKIREKKYHQSSPKQIATTKLKKKCACDCERGFDV